MLQRDRERERLERRAGLALAQGGEVERILLVVLVAVDQRSADHRADLAGLVVDRDQRGRRLARAGRKLLGDRLLGGLLQLEVDRGADLQAAVVGAELGDRGRRAEPTP